MTKEHLKKLAANVGFDLCGVAKADYVGESAAFVDKWLFNNFHATMGWMENNREKRYNPTLLVDGCKSVVVCAISYQTFGSMNGVGVADYAKGDDYHYIVRDMLKRLLEEIKKDEPEVEGRGFCDSAPVLERYWAVKSGLGWQGKSGLVVNRDFGSWIILGVLLTSQIFESYDTPYLEDGCKNCSLCVESCPSAAILSSRTVDCNRCLSYLTIEHKGELSQEQKTIVESEKRWYFGCDGCLSVCPYNKKAYKALTVEVSEKRSAIFGRDKYIFPSTQDELTPEVIKSLKKTPLSRRFK